jgi:hypothetical protein
MEGLVQLADYPMGEFLRRGQHFESVPGPVYVNQAALRLFEQRLARNVLDPAADYVLVFTHEIST